jgi:hypothetical protein
LVSYLNRLQIGFRVIGVEARHASILMGTLIAKMTLDEAQALICELLESWIKNLIGQV